MALLSTACGDELGPIYTVTPTPTLKPTLTPTPASTATPTLTPTATPAFPDTFGPGVHSAGVGIVQGTFCFDLDSGEQSPCSDDQHDFWWQQQSEVERFLVPENGARLGVWGEAAPTREDCAGTPLSTEPSNGSDTAENEIPEGTYVCAQTSDGRMAAFQIATYAYDLVLDHIVWAVAPSGTDGP